MEIMKTLGLSRQIYQHYRRLYCLPIRRGSSQTEITQNSKLKNTPLKPAQKVPTEYILTEVEWSYSQVRIQYSQAFILSKVRKETGHARQLYLYSV